MAIPKMLVSLTSDIRRKIYGRDVRESIAKGIEVSGEISEESNERSKQTAARQDDVENRFDDQMAGNTDIDEVIDARRPRFGEAFPTVGRRMDQTDEELGDKFERGYFPGSINARLAEREISVRDFGALGDGVTDDFEAIQATFDYAKNHGGRVFFPAGDFITENPLTVFGETKVYGSGFLTRLRKTTDAALNLGSETHNTILYLNGLNIGLEDMRIVGNEETNAITFNGYRFELSKLRIDYVKKAFQEYQSCFGIEMTSVNVAHSMEAFCFNSRDVQKTTISLKNCIAENCGQSYDFVRVNYSGLSVCAADWGNYTDNNPYGKGFGDKTTRKGVYNFENCRAITMTSVGAENCFNNGVVTANAADVDINGLNAYFINSRYIPNYTNNPTWGIGAISTGSALTAITASGLYLEGIKNEVVQERHPEKAFHMIANNYSTSAYGAIERDFIIVQSVLSETIKPLFGGQNGTRNCLYVPGMLRDTQIKNSMVQGLTTNYTSRILNGSGSRIIIPIEPRSDAHTPFYIKVKGLNAESSSNQSKAFYADIGVSALTTINQNIQTLSASSGVTVTRDGSNVVIETGQSYTSGVLLQVEVMSRRMHLLDVDDIRLAG